MPTFEATIPSGWSRERALDYLADFDVQVGLVLASERATRSLEEKLAS